MSGKVSVIASLAPTTPQLSLTAYIQQVITWDIFRENNSVKS